MQDEHKNSSALIQSEYRVPPLILETKKLPLPAPKKIDGYVSKGCGSMLKEP